MTVNYYKVAAILSISALTTACGGTSMIKSTIDQVAANNGIEVEYDSDSAFGMGLPTKKDFTRRYGTDNCIVDSYMEMRDRYISTKSVLSSIVSNEAVDEPGSSARLKGVDPGQSNFSLSPEVTHVFYVDELEGSQGFGNYKIEVSSKGFGCSIKEYIEHKL